jgi:hypothetical protein
MYLQSIKSVKHNAAKSGNRLIWKKSRHIGFGVCLYSSFVHGQGPVDRRNAPLHTVARNFTHGNASPHRPPPPPHRRPAPIIHKVSLMLTPPPPTHRPTLQRQQSSDHLAEVISGIKMKIFYLLVVLNMTSKKFEPRKYPIFSALNHRI